MLKTRKIKKIKGNYSDPERPRLAANIIPHTKTHKPVAIRIVSYNIRLARKVDKAIRLLENDKQLREADILCLQEMDAAGVIKIAHALKYNYIYYPAIYHPRTYRDFGNAILSKWPIVDDKKIILPLTKRQKLQRIAVRATILIHDIHLFVFCLHMKVFLKPHHRSDQVDQLLKQIPANIKHCIVAGDFNTYTKRNQKALSIPFKEANFFLATEDVGWTHRLLHRKNFLDHIYIKGMEVTKSGKVTNRKPSDHLPIWAECQLV